MDRQSTPISREHVSPSLAKRAARRKGGSDLVSPNQANCLSAAGGEQTPYSTEAGFALGAMADRVAGGLERHFKRSA